MVSFKRANMPIQIAAKALGMDAQTVRVMCQLELVPWGKCWKNPGSRHFQYFISPAKFYAETGFLWKEGLADGNDEV